MNSDQSLHDHCLASRAPGTVMTDCSNTVPVLPLRLYIINQRHINGVNRHNLISAYPSANSTCSEETTKFWAVLLDDSCDEVRFKLKFSVCLINSLQTFISIFYH